jgi:hypothetical protein
MICLLRVVALFGILIVFGCIIFFIYIIGKGINMRIERGQMIAGFTAFKVRSVMKKMARDCLYCTLEHFMEELNCGKVKGKKFINNMIKLGYLEKAAKSIQEKNRTFYLTTEMGNALGYASARPPIKRATAEKKVAELIERVKEVNTSNFAYKVSCVIVFGSFLSNSETVNDIDVAVGLEDTFKDHKAQINLCVKLIKESGFFFRSDERALRWLRNEVLLKLKNRSPMYSFHDTWEVMSFKRENESFDFKVIYTRK